MAGKRIRSGVKAIARQRRAARGKDGGLPGPSDNPATNLLLADVTIRAGTYILRRSVEKGFLQGRYGKNTAHNIVKNKSLRQSLLSFALARLATKNLPGAIIVGGGAIVKTLYDRRQGRKRARRKGDKQLLEQARGE